jgi:tetratricopeptide (TPR) repeat protein
MSKAGHNKEKHRAIKRANQPNPVPDYLLRKPNSARSIPPPVHTRQQLLPLHELTWENFERLCKSLIERDNEVRSCHMYGRLGQNQKGIDLIAYPRDFQSRRPQVYQCKRVEIFGRTHIRSAVDRFIKTKWRPRPTHFVICCKASLSSTACQDEILTQTRRLQESNIIFEHWDAEQLSTKLKDSPKIVDDFFGREWVKLFVGSEVAEALEQKFQPAATGVGIQRSDQLAALIVSKELELQNLKSTLDVELSANCDRIKDKYKQGRHSAACNELQSYIDRFQTDLHEASPIVRAKFWYTLGVLSWNVDGAARVQECLENARKIDPTFDLRPLEARVLFASREADKALTILQPVDTLPAFTLSLALFLELGRVTEFDNLWAAARFQADSVAFQLLAYRYRLDRRFAEARDAIRTAIDLSPTISSQNITAGHIIFWEAIPEHLDPRPRVILPATFHRLFFRPTSLQIELLNEAIESYDRAITQLSQFGAEEAQQIREIEGFRLLCLSYQSHRQPEAKRLALQLLRADPTNFAALFYCMERGVEFNTIASVSALEERCANKCATLDEIIFSPNSIDVRTSRN